MGDRIARTQANQRFVENIFLMKELSRVAGIINEIAANRCDVADVGLDFVTDERNPGGEIGSMVRSALLREYLEPNHPLRLNVGPLPKVWISGRPE